MKKIVKIVILILIFTFAVSFKSALVYAWDDCPKGRVNDPYPGDCARYIDTDQNGICDHSEPAPEDRVNQDQVPLENKINEKDDVFNDQGTGNLRDNQPKNIDPTSESNLGKYLTAIGIVVFHLTAILIYALVKKKNLAKA